MHGAIKSGTVCKVKVGRRIGQEVTVNKVEGHFAYAKTAKGKERKFNILHLDVLENTSRVRDPGVMES